MEEETEKLFGDKKIPLKETIKRSFHYLRPEIWSLILAGVLIIVNVLTQTVLPVVMGQITDELSKAATDISLTVILSWALGYFGITVFDQVILYFMSMILQKAGQRIVYRLRMEVFTHIERMSLNQFNIMPVGSLVTRVASYTDAMSNLFTSILVNLLRNALTVAAVFITMFVTSWQMSLYMLPFVIVVFALSFVFSKIVSKFFRKERKCQSDVNAFLSENISGIKITQIFNQQERKREEFRAKNKEFFKAKYTTISAFGIYRPLINFIYYMAIAVTFLAGVFSNAVSPGTIVAFYLLISRFFNPIIGIADNLNGLHRATTSSERLFNLLDVKPDVLDQEDAIEIDKFEGRIEFDDVWFSYKNNDHYVLKGVSFKIEPKQTVAFVGATGAGKTTILSLIVRNFEPQKGHIYIDGIDIKKIKIESLKKAIGQMLQDVFLFSGTIKDNVTLHSEEFTDEQIKETCEYVNANQFIEKLPNQYDEMVSERGENFSSGQRQLLSFARTVLHKPQILILDEATANIDTETEVLIQESLQKIKNIGTMLVVAHRLSTIQHADNIIVLNQGNIIEQGKHQDLLKLKGYYYKLYKLQFEKKDY